MTTRRRNDDLCTAIAKIRGLNCIEWMSCIRDSKRHATVQKDRYSTHVFLTTALLLQIPRLSANLEVPPPSCHSGVASGPLVRDEDEPRRFGLHEIGQWVLHHRSDDWS